MHTTKYPTKKVYPPARRAIVSADRPPAVVRGLTAEEYQALREAVEEQIPFPVRLTVNEQRYVFGTLNILPTKQDRLPGSNFPHWTQEQYDCVRDFMQRHGLTIVSTVPLDPDKHYVFSSGLWYVYRAD
jgi:hypothetical protein